MAVSPEDSEDLAAEIAAEYAKAETSVFGRLASLLGTGLNLDSWATSRRNQSGVFRRALASILRPVFTRGRKAAANAAKEAERRGVAQADEQLGDSAKGLPGPNGKAAKEATTQMNRDLKQAERHIVKSSVTAYQRIITETAQAVEAGTSTRLTAASRALAKFANAGITGFVDKAGRNWELSSYVEMAMRTHVSNAMINAHIGRLDEAGIKLVMVSEAPYECEKCKPWEGKVLEVGGKSGKHSVKVKQGNKTVTVQVAGSLDEARAKGLFHPNCRHSVEGFMPGITRAPKKADTKGVSYKDTQKLRRIERQARQWDRRRAAALNDDQRKAADAKFKEYRAKARAHATKTGLPRKTNRERDNATR